MLISIIIPAYNVETYLQCCIDSVLAALHRSCMTETAEILLVTGCSNDQTDFLCRYYETCCQWIHVIPQNASGLSNARNCGLAAARGTYIIFLDGDDFVDPAYFGKMLDMLGRQTYEMVAFDFNMVSEGEAPLMSRRQIPDLPYPQTGKALLHHFLSSSCSIWNVWRYVYSTEFLRKNQLNFRENRTSEDIEFTVRAFLAARTVFFWHHPYYCYRAWRKESLFNSPDEKHIRDFLFIVKECKKMLDRFQGTSSDGKKKYFCYPAKERLLLWCLFREFILCTALLPSLPYSQRKILEKEYKREVSVFSSCFPCSAFLFGLMPIGIVSWSLQKVKNYRRKKSRDFQIRGRRKNFRQGSVFRKFL
ncbi:glycosyltransferase family 2 protein [bacterium 1XD42-76]|nr:glycosyltransferase family 2 protein [bacterium 1XD42-76]